VREGRERQRSRECKPAAEYERAPPPRDRHESEHRLDDSRGEAGEREQQPDLGVREREVVADQRPRGLAGTEDELVE